MNRVITIPNILTVSRVVLIPFFIMAFFLESNFGHLLAIAIFAFCCVTDYLDGYYARAYKQTTKLGQMLDPLADKVLISITVLFIIGFGKVSIISIIPASIILCREILISGVRDATFSHKKNFSTSGLSKWKTASQMVSIGLILISDACPPQSKYFLSKIGETIFWLAAIIAVISGISYCKTYWKSVFPHSPQ